MEYSNKIVLDRRRTKDNGRYPLKLRVYSTRTQIKKLYSLKYAMTEKEFDSVWECTKPRKENQEIRNELQSIVARANDVCKSIETFSFEQFERKYLRKANDGLDVMYQYQQVINKLKSTNSLSTASNYEMSLNSLKKYVTYLTGKEPQKIPFVIITSDWLQNYEDYMINHLRRSRTTVSMYLRALRTVFNRVIGEKEISEEIYPFGKNKYQPPAVSSVKKALNDEQLGVLFRAEPKTPEQHKAKDFWFFSYACNGMNIKDIALLKKTDLQEDRLVFYRAKTINTSKGNLRPVDVYLQEYSKSIIDKYRNNSTNTSEYLFPIISEEETNIANHKKIKNFTKFINQNLKKLAISVGITGEISTYWARHSFATNAIRKGASMAFVMEALAHNNMKTTQGYFAGFEDGAKKDFMKTLMNFQPTKS
jgi:integrase/recombinase XerD